MGKGRRHVKTPDVPHRKLIKIKDVYVVWVELRGGKHNGVAEKQNIWRSKFLFCLLLALQS